MTIDMSPWMRAAARPGALVFALLYTLESLSRATLITIIPLQALALFRDPSTVSLLFALVGMAGLAGSFVIPLLIRRARRRWVYTLGAVLSGLAAVLLATVTEAGQILGMLARVFGGACLNITLNLYIMDTIGKRDLVRSEPLKQLIGATAWTTGPFIGVWLYRASGPAAAAALSAGFALLLLAYFWSLRISDNPAVAAATRPPPNPAASIRRFLSQPRLRLGWAVPFGRSCWWAIFVTYVPIYMVERGAGAMAGALLVSLGHAMLYLTPIAGRIARHVGLRTTITASFLLMAIATVAAGFSTRPLATGAFLLIAAVAAAALDAVGNIPFLRAVRSHERPQMTTVFRTYIDISDLLPTAIFALLLLVFEIEIVFVAGGLAMFGFALLARHVPRGM